jgi:predicted Zn-dependent protease
VGSQLIRLTAIAATLALTASAASAQTRELPDFGSPADSVLSKSREMQIGRGVMLQMRNAGAIIDDPQITEYVRLLGSQLASQANDGDFQFEFFVVDNSQINAFAMPGGFIGLNLGLIVQSENESELAGVVAHEVSHVTQRHIARSMYDAQKGSILSTAAMLAGVLLGALGDLNSEAVGGLVMAGQSAGMQRQINFTRAHESEADRIGMDVLSRAGFDPSGMASFFEKLSRRASPTAQMIPEMLRTHPIGTGRIAEARSRARQLPPQTHEDTIGYGIAKARLMVLSSERPEDAVAAFAHLRDSNRPADRYGRAFALTGVGRDDEAERIFHELAAENPNVIAYRIGEAEALMSSGLEEQAMRIYTEAIELFPRNVPLVISYADALIVAGRPDIAHEVLLDLLNNVPPTPEQILLISRAANAEGDSVSAYHYMSEYYASIGDLRLAINQLQMALEAPDVNSIERVRFLARLELFREYLPDDDRRRSRRN